AQPGRGSHAGAALYLAAKRTGTAFQTPAEPPRPGADLQTNRTGQEDFGPGRKISGADHDGAQQDLCGDRNCAAQGGSPARCIAGQGPRLATAAATGDRETQDPGQGFLAGGWLEAGD